MSFVRLVETRPRSSESKTEPCLSPGHIRTFQPDWESRHAHLGRSDLLSRWWTRGRGGGCSDSVGSSARQRANQIGSLCALVEESSLGFTSSEWSHRATGLWWQRSLVTGHFCPGCQFLRITHKALRSRHHWSVTSVLVVNFSESLPFTTPGYKFSCDSVCLFQRVAAGRARALSQ